MKSFAGLPLVGRRHRRALRRGGADPEAAARRSLWHPGATASLNRRTTPAFSSSASRRDCRDPSASKSHSSSSRTSIAPSKALLPPDLDSYEGGTGGNDHRAPRRAAGPRVVGCNYLPRRTASSGAGRYRHHGRPQGLRRWRCPHPGSFPEIFARAAFEKAGSPSLPSMVAAIRRRQRSLPRELMAGVVDAAIITNEFIAPARRQTSGGHHAGERSDAGFHAGMRADVRARPSSLRRDDAVPSSPPRSKACSFAMSHRDDKSSSPGTSPA